MKRIILSSFLAITASNTLAQVCNPNIVKTKPDAQYVIGGDNEELVIDTETGLMWMRCSLGKRWYDGNCFNTETRYTWQEALNVADTFKYSGFDDWRLPNIKELGSLLELACRDAPINEVMFPNTVQTYYWSASNDAYNAKDAWIVFFASGRHINTAKNTPLAVRLVRNGQ
ncbi:MAG: DUF1566 domain-containing protein [Saccharospirillaceae bacterium]|nr:DUF1566 domain-containing protein [Pseudomonadales bacterium]NRB81347.1 DUF1566 domain-containing protein [Saccharospirillaceae bacterium]